MMHVPAPAAHTRRFKSFAVSDFSNDSKIVVSGNATETRGSLPIWSKLREQSPERLVLVEPTDDEMALITTLSGESVSTSLRDSDALSSVLATDKLLIDVSGLPHHVWAPLLKAARGTSNQLRVLYAEPEAYRFHPSPSSSTLFELSEEFGGIGPLPGFAHLSGPENEQQTLFVPMLGFEGSRPESLLMHINPPPRIIPIVGVPGFQMHFPTYTIACNRELLVEYGAQSEIRLARASCPFEAYNVLKQIQRDYPDYYIYLAPVGTKPHSLAAVWFSLDNPNTTEIIFDHPTRKKGRTIGVGTVHIYDFGAF